MFDAVARSVDLLSTSFVLGATIWFFFVQSPLLLRRMGRESFVPLQMQLTFVLFQSLTLALALAAVAAVAHRRVADAVTIAAGVALLGGLTNRFVIVPRALRAGGQSRKAIAGKDDQSSTADFASVGAGSKTKTLHRAVVLLVVVMLAGAVVHGVALVT